MVVPDIQKPASTSHQCAIITYASGVVCPVWYQTDKIIYVHTIQISIQVVDSIMWAMVHTEVQDEEQLVCVSVFVSVSVYVCVSVCLAYLCVWLSVWVWVLTICLYMCAWVCMCVWVWGSVVVGECLFEIFSVWVSMSLWVCYYIGVPECLCVLQYQHDGWVFSRISISFRSRGPICDDWTHQPLN